MARWELSQTGWNLSLTELSHHPILAQPCKSLLLGPPKRSINQKPGELVGKHVPPLQSEADADLRVSRGLCTWDAHVIDVETRISISFQIKDCQRNGLLKSARCLDAFKPEVGRQGRCPVAVEEQDSSGSHWIISKGPGSQPVGLHRPSQCDEYNSSQVLQSHGPNSKFMNFLSLGPKVKAKATPPNLSICNLKWLRHCLPPISSED